MKLQKRNLYLTLFLGIQILLMRWIESNPSFVEAYYSTGIYPYISSLFRILLGWIPFSIGDLLIFFFIFYCLRFIYRLFKTRFKGFLNKVFGITAFASVIYFCFYLLWGLNYYRKPLSKNLGYETTKYSNEQLIDLSNHLISKLNETQILITQSDTLKVENPYSQKEMYALARNGYDELAKDLPQFTYKYGTAKSSLMSLFQSYNGTSGYLNPLTGEAQVNNRVPKTSYPTTTCHEMAHQIGFAAENEANFVGFLAALSNEDIYFKYAAYRMATRYVIFELYKRDSEKYWEVYKTINKGIIKDFRASSAFWKTYENPFEPLMKKGYNVYLKSNKQQNGVNSYNYVVDLLINYYKDEISQNMQQRYLVSKTPDNIPIPFMSKLTPKNKLIHRGVFSSDFNSYYYTLSDKNFKQFDVYLVEKKGNEWTAPKKAFFNSRYNEHGMSFSPDGNSIYFSSTRPTNIDGVSTTWHLWKSEKRNGQWNEPIYIDIPNLDNKLVSHPTISKTGNLYFHASNLDYSNMNLYYTKEINGTYENAKELKIPTNRTKGKCTPYISPNDTYLIFASIENPLNLMISFRDKNGVWKKARKFNDSINKNSQGNPHVTPDGKFLLYAVENQYQDTWEIHWVNITSEIRE